MAKIILSTFIAALLVALCSAAQPVSDGEIARLTETLFLKIQTDLLKHVQLNFRQCTTCRLFNVSEEVLNSVPTIVKMRALFDNYNSDASVNEQMTDVEKKEEQDFISALLKTDVIKTLMKFLTEKGYVKDSFADQFSLLNTMWFSVYTRGGGIRGSSGFEHVFLHEVKNHEISGLHNWIYYHELEQTPNHPLHFLKLTRQLSLANKAQIIKYQFALNNVVKPTNTMFVGTPPEFDISLYTLCIILQKEDCKISMDGNHFIIKAHPYFRGRQVLVGSTYPQI